MSIPILSLIILIPLVLGLVTLLTKTHAQARIIALISSIAVMILTLYAYFNFNSASAQMQFEEIITWIPSMGINYHLGIDGISMPLVLLNAIVLPLLVLYTWNDTKEGANKFYALILITQAAIIGVFLALDFFLFYIFWELTLVPLFFMVNMWGGVGKSQASIKFFIYTHIGSLVMLLGIFALYFSSLKETGTPSMNIQYLLSNFKFIADGATRDIILIALLFGFLVKIPSFPFHSWVPDAYVEAPTAGSVLFVLMKIGGYGLFRVILPILPFTPSMHIILNIMGLLGGISILYGAFLALAQKDLKRMVAYSSISHMGYVTLGAAGFVSMSVAGAMFQQFSHGLIMTIMFMSCGIINRVTGTRIINDLGGMAQKMPKLAVIMVFTFMASLGLPGLTGFIAEFYVLTFSFIHLPTYVILAILAIIITAGYHLWALQRTMFGVYNEKNGITHDISSTQTFAMGAIVILILFFGLYPNPVMDMMILSSQKIFSLMVTAGV